MASYILRPEGMTEAEFVERRNAHLYGIWLLNNELDREDATRRAKANREKYPVVEFISHENLWLALTTAHGALKDAHEKWGGIDTDEARKNIRAVNEAYFMFRHEHDYRQAQGC